MAINYKCNRCLFNQWVFLFLPAIAPAHDHKIALCRIFQQYMNLGQNIRKIREAKGLTSKEVALSCKMGPAQYSRIENNITDPSFSSVVKIARALGVTLADFLSADEVVKNAKPIDKNLTKKLALIECLGKKEKAVFFAMLDVLAAKKKLRIT